MELSTQPTAQLLTDRLRTCFEQQRFDELADVYAEHATFELHVGSWHEQRRGSDSIVKRYANDFASAATFAQWDVRPAPWGAVVQAEALQAVAGGPVRFRWVHLLTVEGGRITDDTVYCTGALPDS